MPIWGKGGCCSYKTILGTKGKVSVDKFVRKRFIQANGKKLDRIDTGGNRREYAFRI